MVLLQSSIIIVPDNDTLRVASNNMGRSDRIKYVWIELEHTQRCEDTMDLAIFSSDMLMLNLCSCFFFTRLHYVISKLSISAKGWSLKGVDSKIM